MYEFVVIHRELQPTGLTDTTKCIRIVIKIFTIIIMNSPLSVGIGFHLKKKTDKKMKQKDTTFQMEIFVGP